MYKKIIKQFLSGFVIIKEIDVQLVPNIVPKFTERVLVLYSVTSSKERNSLLS